MRKEDNYERFLKGKVYSVFARKQEHYASAVDEAVECFGEYVRERCEIGKLDRTLNRALERLQSEGYCVEKNPSQLVSKMCCIMPEAMPSVFSLTENGGVFCEKPVAYDIMEKNAKEMWKQAIEIVVMTHDPNLLCSKEPRTIFLSCKAHISEIYQTFFHRLTIAQLTTCIRYEEEATKMKREAERILKKAKREARDGKAQVRATKDATTFELETAKQKIQSLERAVLESERENSELKRQNQLLQMLLDSSDEEDAPEEETLPESETEISEDELYRSVELPEDQSILFLGGHRNFVKKVQENHPNWRYISSTDHRLADSVTANTNLKCIVFYSKHVSHPIYYSIVNQNGDVPIIYLDCQNIERGERIIRKEYAEKVLGLTKEKLLEMQAKGSASA